MKPTLIAIHNLDHEGRGVGRMLRTEADEGETDSRVVFVTGALPGEVVWADRFSEKKKFLRAQLMQVVKPSSQRIEAGCPHFSLCGGCSQQHLNHAAQVAYKQRGLEENFARLAQVMPENWATPIYGPDWHYRRRARLSVRFVEKKGRLLVGFHEKGGRFVADLQSCKILAEPFGRLIPELAACLGALHAKRHIAQLEVSVGDHADGRADPLMVVRHLVDLDEHDCNLLRAFSAQHDVAVYLQPNNKNINLLAPIDHQPCYHLPEQGLALRFAPSDFIQVNALGNQALVTRALAWLALTPNDRVLDGFCGLGNFTLALAQALMGEHSVLWGIEGDQGLVERARENLVLNGLNGRAEFALDNLFAPSAATVAVLSQVNKILLDPPRDGAESLCRIMPEHIERLVYVSCHPATLARDAAILVHERGFRCVRAGVVNLFPHTNHVESMALFVRQ